jgi:endoglucanase
MGVAIGDPIAFDIKYVNLGKDAVIGKAFDNRAGCIMMVETLKLLGHTDCTVCAVGTVQEEVGLRGAAAAAFGVDPDLALALDVTIAGDVPGVREFDTSVKMGKGPALTISDSRLITHPRFAVAYRNRGRRKIPFQIESGLLAAQMRYRISITRQGIPCGNVSIATRYIHSPVGMLSLKDIENSAKLTAAAIQKATKYF